MYQEQNHVKTKMYLLSFYDEHNVFIKTNNLDLFNKLQSFAELIPRVVIKKTYFSFFTPYVKITISILNTLQLYVEHSLLEISTYNLPNNRENIIISPV